MSSSYPPGGTPGPEYLEQGGGSPLSPEPKQRTSTRNRRPALIAGGALAGILLVGGGVWAASWYLRSGPQPAEALPASTLGYISIDLDPSGQQKIEALRTLNKFPAIKEQLDLSAEDDVRKRIFEEIRDSGECQDVDYDDDIAPWLGDRMALAAVDAGGEQPSPVFVVQVTDADAADAGLSKLRDCGNEGTSEVSGGWAIDGDWAVVAETDAVAKKVADETAEGSLADDSAYQRWTDEAGDPGVVTMYAAPAAGKYFADNLDQLESLFGGSSGSACSVSAEPSTAPFSDSDDVFACGDPAAPTDDLVPPEAKDALQNFQGAAASIRFDDGALELEVAGDPGVTAARESLSGSDRGADVVATLPEDTAAAFGVGLEDGWFSDLVKQMASSSGESASEMMSKLSGESGLDLPGDAETLLGDSLAFSVGSDFDPESFFNSSDGSGLPIAAKVQGDPAAIEKVLDKLRAQAGPAATVLGSDSAGDMIAVGPDAGYRSHILDGGSLGDTAVFNDVVPEADRASALFFVNFDAGDWLTKLAAGDQEAVDNLEPLEGLGASAWTDDDSSHLVLRLVTN